MFDRLFAKIDKIYHNPKRLLLWCWNKTSCLYSDKMYLKGLYYLRTGKKLNLKSPKTYNEKLNWLKLYDRNPAYTKMVDKYAVKKYVASIIGEDYIIPTIGVWENPEDIVFSALPKQFVLKTTHGGGNGGVIVIKDKERIDYSSVISKLKFSMRQNIYKSHREWPYKNVERKIIAEKYMEDTTSQELVDYKFFCFNGEVKALFIATERSSGDVKFDYFDADFNHLDLVQVHSMSGKVFKKPETFDEMKKIASKLSKGIPQVRIDLYEVNGKVYFGEMTFFHHGGITPFYPEEWDYKFGSWINLPSL